MNLNKKIYKQRTKVRHYLKKHYKLQKIVSSTYLKYCSFAGVFHTVPDFLIIGFPKCGTTSLYEYLIQHPSIHSASGKEIDYFDRLHTRGFKWYKMSFPLIFTKFFYEKFSKQKFLTGEATPRYMLHPNALNNIKLELSNPKFIVLLRNPVDRAYSHYMMNVKNDYEHKSFEDALNSEHERIDGRYEKMINDKNYYSWDYDLFAYLEHGKYVEKIKRWMKIFPKENFLFIQSEEFSKEPSKIYVNVLNFLGLYPFELKTYKKFKKRNYEQQKLDISLRKKLQNYFRSYNEELFKLLNINYNWND